MMLRRFSTQHNIAHYIEAGRTLCGYEPQGVLLAHNHTTTVCRACELTEAKRFIDPVRICACGKEIESRGARYCPMCQHRRRADGRWRGGTAIGSSVQRV